VNLQGVHGQGLAGRLAGRETSRVSPEGSPVESSQLTTLQQALVGLYRVEREIGRGGMGVVYRAERLDDGHLVALKVIRHELAAAVALDRFHREIEVGSTIRHPRIVPVERSGSFRHPSGLDIPYYDMPLVEGESLRSRLDRDGALPLEDALRIIREIGEGLAEAHRAGVVHRDLKPENVLLTDTGAMLLDFGAARAVTQSAGRRITSSGITVGTPTYMSPEQASADQHLDGRSDIYSLGCLLYELLAGEPPFGGPTALAIVSRHFRETPRSLRIVRPGVPEAIDRLVAKALAKLPADRFQTIEEFLNQISGAALPATPPPSRHPWRARVGGGGALLLLALVVWRMIPAAPRLLPTEVVVYPLVPVAANADPEVGWDAALAIGQALEHTEPLRFLDGWRELDSLARRAPATLTPAQARRTATRVHAAHFIEGTIRLSDASAAITLRLVDTRTGRQVGQETETGDRGMVPQIAVQAASRLLVHLIAPGSTVDLSGLTDRHAGAIALWLLGDRAYRESRFNEALTLYERAVAADSLLGIAAVKGAQAAGWVNDFGRADRLLATALAIGPTLPSRWRRLAQGLQAFSQGQADRAVQILTSLTRDSPEWPEAAMALGETYHHLLPAAPALDTLASSWFLRAALIDSSFAPARVHLAEIALRHGRVPEADRWIGEHDRIVAESPSRRHLALMRECVANGSDRDAWTRAAQATPRDVFTAAKELSGGGRQSRCATDAASALLRAVPDSTDLAYSAFLIHHGLLMAAGRYENAERMIDSAVAAGRRSQAAYYVLDLSAGAPVTSRAGEVDSAQRARRGDHYAGASADLLWLMSLYHLSRGDSVRVRQIADSLASRRARGGTAKDSLLAPAVAAHAALAAGDTARAISLLPDLRSAGSRESILWDLPNALAPERFLLAQLLLARGRPEEALTVAGIFDHPQPTTFLIFLGPSLRLRAEAAEALARRGAAPRDPPPREARLGTLPPAP